MKVKHMITDLYLLCPLDSILAGVVANLALEVTKGFVAKVINVGLQWLLKQSAMGHSWLLSGDMMQCVSRSKTKLVVVVCRLVAAGADHSKRGGRTVTECKVHVVVVLGVV